MCVGMRSRVGRGRERYDLIVERMRNRGCVCVRVYVGTTGNIGDWSEDGVRGVRRC